jgi:hypothetical protein
MSAKISGLAKDFPTLLLLVLLLTKLHLKVSWSRKTTTSYGFVLRL